MLRSLLDVLDILVRCNLHSTWIERVVLLPAAFAIGLAAFANRDLFVSDIRFLDSRCWRLWRFDWAPTSQNRYVLAQAFQLPLLR